MADRKPVTRSAIDEDVVIKIVEKLLNSKQFLDKIIGTICDSVAKQFNEKVKLLETKVGQLSQEIFVLQEKVVASNDALEQYSRCNSVRIFGLPQERNEDTTKLVIQLCNGQLGLDITEADIDCSHRLPVKSGMCPPIIVKFCRRTIKNSVLRNKRKLKESKIVVREDLTKRRAQLLKLSGQKYGQRNVWSMGGTILARIGNGVKKIVSERDLQDVDSV